MDIFEYLNIADHFVVLMTCRGGPVLAGGLAGLAVAHAVHTQHSERVVDVRRELQLRRGARPRSIRQVDPHPRLVEQILVLDQKLCGWWSKY